jgi:pseudaminic acid biosynthesis-associated methylase
MKVGQKQLKEWTGSFGADYTKRNDLSTSEMEKQAKWMLGKSYRGLFTELIGKKKIQNVLEVGCNVGKKLEIISQITKAKLYGIEPQQGAVETVHGRLPNLNVIQGTAYDLPFKDNFFDLVFTSVVLIHVPPKALGIAMREICRVSKKYIMGLEYWENKPTKTIYHGEKELLWKTDFPREFLKNFSELKLVKEMILPYKKEAFGKSGLFLNCYLLEKREK